MRLDLRITGQQDEDTDTVLRDIVTRNRLRLIDRGGHVLITPELYSCIQMGYLTTLLSQKQPWETTRYYNLEFKQLESPPPWEDPNGFVWPTTYRYGVITDIFHGPYCLTINKEGEYGLSKYHGDGHSGIDIGGTWIRGTPVLAVRDGTLLPDSSRELDPTDQDLTLYVTLHHKESGLRSAYRHMDWVVPFSSYPRVERRDSGCRRKNDRSCG